jgi:hypothetical protein
LRNGALRGDERRDGKALALFAAWECWQQGKTKDGRSFFAIPGSESGLFHMANQNDCSCPNRQRARTICKHMRAVRFWMAAFMNAAVSPKREAATAAPNEDRFVLTPKGAASLANLDDDRPEPPVTEQTRAALARMRTEQAERRQWLRDRGYDPGQDGQYLQRAEHIARLEARITRDHAHERPQSRPKLMYHQLMDRHGVEA